MGKILSGIILLLMIGAGAFWGYQLISKPKTVLPQPESPLAAPANLNTYEDKQAGFSFKYPDFLTLNPSEKNITKLSLFVNSEKLSDIPEDLPMMLGRNDALKERDLLTKGTGEGMVKIGTYYGQSSTTLAQFEVCSVIFSRKITFYPNDYRVTISMVGPKDDMIASMPEFFTVDKKNCGDQKMWDQSKSNNFIATLAQKKGRGLAQTWYNTFDSIVKTITVTAPR